MGDGDAAMLIGYHKRPRPFLGKRDDEEFISAHAPESWLPVGNGRAFPVVSSADDDGIGKRVHSKPFLGKRVV